MSNKFFLATIFLATMISLHHAYKSRKGLISILSRRLQALHSTSSSSAESIATTYTTEQQEDFWKKIRQHQAGVPKPSFAEEVRSLIAKSNGYGVISTNSFQNPGFPFGSIIGFQLDEGGFPFAILSTLSSHTADIVHDGRVSLLISEKDFEGADNGRATLLGTMAKVNDSEKCSQLRELYLKRHPGAYWADFGDFAYFRMDSIKQIRYVGGFGRATNVSPADYLAAEADPLLSFSAPVMKHMNDDHRDSMKAMVDHLVGVPCVEASMIGLDKFGIKVRAKLAFDEESSVLRIPFSQKVSDRKAVKDAIVELTQRAISKNS